MSLRSGRAVKLLGRASLAAGWALALALALAVAGELFLRLGPFSEKISVTYPAGYMRPDKEAGYDLAPDRSGGVFLSSRGNSEVFSNELGCYDVPYAPPPGAKAPVLLVGDSFTWGYAPFDRTFGSVAEGLLGRRVLKCGVPGYGTRQELIKASRLSARVRPSLIILAYFTGNDMEDDYLFPSRGFHHGGFVDKRRISDLASGEIAERTEAEIAEGMRRSGILSRFGLRYFPDLRTLVKANSLLYNALAGAGFMRRAAWPFFRQPVPMLDESTHPWVRGAWENHLANIGELKALADANGAGLLVLILPNKYQVADDAAGVSGRADWGAPGRRVADYCRGKGIEYLDLAPDFAAYAAARRSFISVTGGLYWRYDGHLSPSGHRLAGILIAGKLAADAAARKRSADALAGFLAVR